MRQNKTFTLKTETLKLLRELEEQNSINLSAFADKLLSRESKKILNRTSEREKNNA